MRAYVFRFAPESGHCATQPACPFRATSGSRGRGLLDQIAGARETGRRVTLEVLLCGGRRYKSEPAIDRYGISIQIFGNGAAIDLQ